ncbi:uncharacterized protein SPSC_06000 [Sporisorium scitamineum]|uniref:Uncharacterized protein n=1 Tax=Sporisorium scitamineum TaxID=49012 RepID=A0A0F7S5U1_9BASI|nr:uncharacterized protein SPSC_06000 [Sporisorium scitamineum]CDW94983.1 hypothetical protein [Sporisorium scitamineum]
MGIITFVTPPGRPSVLRGNTVQEARAQHADPPPTQATHASGSALRHTNSEPTPAQDAHQLVEHQPLTFQKRILPQLTTSPEPAAESFDLPPSRKSLDEANSHRMHAGESKKPSLLSTAMVASSAYPPRSASTTNLGILRRAESENARSSLDGASRVAGDASDATTSAPRPRLHFIEPHKQPASHVSARPDTAVGTTNTNEGNATTTNNTVAPALSSTTATAATQYTAEVEPAPRKRSLVIQEHADVLERAAERAARQANHLSSQALEQHTHTGAFVRSRQHSTSSAGDETASTRSSWALRSSPRGSSTGTSPSLVSDDNAQESPQIELSKPSERPPIVPIFTKANANDRVDAAGVQPPPANPPRKLTFISPAPSKRRRLPETKPVSPTRRESDHNATASSSRNVSAVNDGEGQAPTDASRRVLAFAACPKPQRAARLSPAHATRKPKSNLSASPAPHKLAYPQRLRGIRGSDPIRSPAPDKARIASTQAAKWDELLEDVSSEGSGYSEDEEDGDSDQDQDGDDDDDDHDALSDSSPSDNQSLIDSLLEKSEDSASLLRDDASSSIPDSVEELREEAVEAGELANRPSSKNAQAGQQTDRHPVGALLSDSEPSSSRQTSSRRSSSALPDPRLAARTSFANQTSPPRLSHPSRSTQTSPMSSLPGRTSRKLRPKESFSHPMCFLPDAFEDSAPPTPTEPESDAYESSQRANLLLGWLSEGGSAASSRRASWQPPLPPASPRAHGEGQEELAVPITLPPFRRTRERTAQQGVMSDGEQNSRSLGGNAAFIRESAGFGRNDEPLEQRSAGVSPRASQGPHSLGISVPLQGRPSQPVSWRHLSSQHVPSAGAVAYRRASHSMEPRRYSSTVTSPIGSYSHTHAAGRFRQNAGLERPVRPSAGKQRAVSTSSHIRSRPSVAPSMHDDVVVATSPPRDDASALLKHLAHSPKSAGEAQRGVNASGSTTPGWMSDGQLPSQTSRYWTERLSSLAQAVSEELSIVGSAVLGKEKLNDVEEGEHRRAHSVLLDGLDRETAQQAEEGVEAWARRNSVGVPVPIKPVASEWTADRDGQTQFRGANGEVEVDAEGEDEGKAFQFAKRHVDTDGSTRLVVIHTSNAHASGAGEADAE